MAESLRELGIVVGMLRVVVYPANTTSNREATKPNHVKMCMCRCEREEVEN